MVSYFLVNCDFGQLFCSIAQFQLRVVRQTDHPSLTLLLTRHVGNAHLGDSGSNVSHVRGWLVCERGGRGVTVDGIIGREGGTREGRRRRKNQFGRLRRNGFHVKSQRPPPAQSHRIGRAEKLGSYVTPSQLNSLTSSIV